MTPRFHKANGFKCDITKSKRNIALYMIEYVINSRIFEALAEFSKSKTNSQ